MDDLEERLFEAVRLVQEKLPDAAKLDMSELRGLSDRDIYILASAVGQICGGITPFAVAVMAAERLMAEDAETGMLWLRLFRAFKNFLQTEPDPGRMSH